MPSSSHAERLAAGATCGLPTPAQMAQFPYLKLPRPRLMRYTLPAAALLRWTLRALRSVNASSGAAPSHTLADADL